MAKSGDAFGAASERAERARELVAAKAFVVTSGAVLVFSDAPGVAGHTVEAGRCSCRDATVGEAARLLNGRCKHSMVSELVLRAPAPRTLAPRESTAWLDEQDEAARRRRAAARMAELEEEMSR